MSTPTALPEFATRVAAERKARGWSRAFLAGASGFTEKTITRWERGETVPDLADAAMVAEALGVSLDYLAGRHDGDPA